MQGDGPKDAAAGQPRYLTTKEAADLLRVKERKVYDLAAEGAIPHRRITGKLLFPHDELLAWIDGGEGASPRRPAILAGSHDPLLDWAARESGSELAALFEGSRAGLDRFAQGAAALAGLHVPESDDDGRESWNVRTVAGLGLRGCVLIAWAARRRGILLSKSARGSVSGFADLRGRRVAMRQPGAGASALFEKLAAEAGLGPDDMIPAAALARTESDAAAAVAEGEAEAALGIEAMARRYGLGFVPLTEERFDLLIDRRAYFTPPVQSLLIFARGAAFRAKAESMGGYDVSDLGAVRWLSP